MKPVDWRVVPQISGLFTFSRGHFRHSWIPAAGQHTLVYLSGPVKRSLDTNSPSHSHALSLPAPRAVPPPRWNSSLPSTDSHVTALFRVDAQTTSCASDSHAPMLPSAPRHMTSPRGEKCTSFFSFFPLPPQHSYHIRCTNPANVTNSVNPVGHLQQTHHRWIVPAGLRPQVSICFTRQDQFCHKGENLSQPFHKTSFFCGPLITSQSKVCPARAQITI